MTLNICRFAALLLFFSACKSDREEEPIPILYFENETLLESHGENCERPEHDCTVISLDYPVAHGPEKASERMNEQVKQHIISIISSEEKPETSDLEVLAEKFVSDYQKTAADFPQEPAWEAYVTGSIYFESDSLISIGITSDMFRGGAHGYRGLSFLNFNPQNGNLYTKEDLFTPEFTDYAERIFRKDQEISSGENINSTGFWFQNDTFQLPENIGFEKDAVLLVYNAYEVAPYSAGNFYLEIPKEEVESYLKVE